jgi:hypothetical protein
MKEDYLSVLTKLYKAQDEELPARVLYHDGRCLTGQISIVQVRNDTFSIEVPGEGSYDDLDINLIESVFLKEQ